jgi:hypothetical protein
MFGVWLFAWTACGASIVAFEPIVTADNVNQLAQNAPAMAMNAFGCGIIAAIGAPIILWACGIFSAKNSN